MGGTISVNETTMTRENWNAMELGELFERLVQGQALENLIQAARREDLGEAGDVTSLAMVEESRQGLGVLGSRKGGRVCGLRLLPLIAKTYDQSLNVQFRAADGERILPGQVLAEVTGPLRGILAAERVMLNFVTHLSGIASLTEHYVDAVEGTGAKIFDTRKTIPGLRPLEKYAVRCGGGFCHRIGLYDAMLVKDNHLAHVPVEQWATVLKAAIEAARGRWPGLGFVEVEVDTLKQLEAVLKCGADVVLLDNMSLEELQEGVRMRDASGAKTLVEASGSVSLGRVRSIAETGVDRVAVGALTHSAPALDIGLDIRRV